MTVLTPDGNRHVAGAALELLDDTGEPVAAGVSDVFEGRWAVEDLPAGAYSFVARTGHFEAAAAFDVVDGDVELALRLSSSLPVVLDVRDEAGRTFDPVPARLEAMGLTSVRQGPESASVAADSFAQPQGLFEYGLVLLGGELDWSVVADDPAAVDGLEDFVRAGGGLVIGASAQPVLEALIPGALDFLVGETAAFGYTEAYTDAALIEHFQWHGVGVPILEGMPLVEDVADHANVALAGGVENLAGELVTAALAVEVELGEGTVLFVTFAAAEPRADEWWFGDPDPYRLPDGSWDGRGAVLDRLLLRL
ncbi:MAG: hypothetical protein GY898_30000 [Proteobacteria bacterium]|nr:hypothetical protein [Pseudomonadota bacterium]